MQKKLQLEVGKYYRNGRGEIIHIIDKMGGDLIPFVGGDGVDYAADGRTLAYGGAKFDLVYEVTDPILQFFAYPRVELLSISAIEAAAGMPSRTLYKFLKGTRGLPKKHRAPLIEILKTLGYDG